MEPAEILEEIQRRGATVQPLEGGRLGVAPGSVLDDELRAEIRNHKFQLLAEIQRPNAEHIEGDPSPLEQLQRDWRQAIERAQAGFAENDITPTTQEGLEAAARLELKALEWTRMDAAHFPRASRLLELLGAVYAGRMTATVTEDGRVAIKAKEATP